MQKPTVILITGHPATGKTTLAHYLAQELCLPLIWKDQIKESLLKTLGTSTTEWSRQLSVVAWNLLYLQIENLLHAKVSHIAESNFDPIYADGRWLAISQKYDFRLIQVRCETRPETLLERYCERIQAGARHSGHVDASKDNDFLDSIQRHMRWIMLESDRFSFDTTENRQSDYLRIAQDLRKLISN